MLLELKDIKKSFGSKQVLSGVSFRAEGGKGTLSEEDYRGSARVFCGA